MGDPPVPVQYINEKDNEKNNFENHFIVLNGSMGRF